jgi:NhaP-type Na+/H+ or K+/H+ antiporter
VPVFSPEQFAETLALIGAVIVISSLLSGFLERNSFPQVAAFLALGAVIGPYGLGIVDVNVNSPILRVVATLSLALVLFTDAVSLDVAELRAHRRLGFLVLGPGTLASAGLISVVAIWMLKISPVLAIMLGAALASTDPVLLRAIIHRRELSAAVRQALRIEGGLNDVVLLPIVLTAIAATMPNIDFGAARWIKLALNMVVLSPAAGVIVALAAIGALELVRKRIRVRRDYESIYSLGIAFTAFAAAESVHGSGFISVFAAGVTVAALDVELCDCFIEYGQTTAEMALLFTFVLFGVSLIWTGITTATPITLLFAAAVILLRPAAFLPALAAIGLPRKDRFLLGWFGPRGLSSLLLILLPVFSGVAGSDYLLTISCLVVLCSVVLHGFSPRFIFRASQASIEVPQPSPSQAATSQPQAAISQPVLRASDEGSSESPEYVETEQLRKLMEADPKSVILADVRSHRSYDESDHILADAVRIDPENPVQEARRIGLPGDALIALFCA